MSALQTQNKLIINYQNRHDNEPIKRLISPQRLTSYKNAWYLDVWCHLRDDIRLFALEQIKSAKPDVEKAKSITQQELRGHYAGSYGIFSGKARYNAKIRINTKKAPWAQFENWHSQQQIIPLDSDHIQLLIPYNDDKELIADILRLGEAAVVEEPESLRKKIKTQLQLLMAQYEQQEKST